MEDKKLGQGLTCFIVGPIGDRLDAAGTEGRLRYENATQIWENVFEPACATFGLTPVRADKIAESGEIPEQIFTYLRDADVVIADLTGGNANVMYELGLRHTRDKITIQIGEHQQLPFDVNTIRTVKFKRTEAGLIDARDSLISSLRAALGGAGTPVTATRVWSEMAAISPDDVAKASALSFVTDDPAADADDDGPGLVDMLATGEESIEKLSDILEDFTAAMNDMGQIADELAPNVAATVNSAGRLTMIRKYADRLKDPAGRFDTISEEYLERVNDVDAMVRVLVDIATKDSDELDAGGLGFLKVIHDLRQTTEEASVSIAEAMQAARELRQLSQQLKPISKSLVHSFNTMLRGNELVAGWGVLVEGVPGSEEFSVASSEDDTTEPASV